MSLTKYTLLFASVCAVAFAISVNAQDKAAGKAARLEKIDTDKDGMVSVDEMKARAKTRLTEQGKTDKLTEVNKRIDERFAKSDSNKDGKLSKEEMEAARKAPVSKEEFVKRAEEKADKRFEKLDANKDGALTPDERKAAREKMKAKAAERKAAAKPAQ